MSTAETDLELMIHAIGPYGVLVSDDGDRANAVWLPVSGCRFEETPRAGKAQIVTVPEWLAKAKGLV